MCFSCCRFPISIYIVGYKVSVTAIDKICIFRNFMLYNTSILYHVDDRCIHISKSKKITWYPIYVLSLYYPLRISVYWYIEHSVSFFLILCLILLACETLSLIFSAIWFREDEMLREVICIASTQTVYHFLLIMQV